jgi:hypothetical protein
LDGWDWIFNIASKALTPVKKKYWIRLHEYKKNKDESHEQGRTKIYKTNVQSSRHCFMNIGYQYYFLVNLVRWACRSQAQDTKLFPREMEGAVLLCRDSGCTSASSVSIMNALSYDKNKDEFKIKIYLQWVIL